MTRRAFLGSFAVLAAFRDDTLDVVEKLLVGAEQRPEASARDEEFWARIQEAFTLDRNVVNFNNGGCSPSPRVVQEVLRRQLELSNEAPSYFMWRQLEPEVEAVRLRLAALFGCDPEELAITRNASEALEICLNGIDLNPGDEILTTTVDYPRMIATIQQRERREGIKMVQASVPAVPRSRSELVAAVEQKMTPRTRLILFSHVCFMNGQIWPVREICALGEKRGVPVLVDGAHAFAQFPFDRQSLGCEMYGTSLHKWLMAPIGTGFLHLKKDRIPSVWSLMASREDQTTDIRKFEEIGTHPAANHNAIGEAIAFHELIGVERKAARLRYLRSRWVDKIRELPRVKFHTNLEPEHSCALTTVEIAGIDPGQLAGWLLSKHSIVVTSIVGPDFGGIRVTPNVYSLLSEVDRFADAMVVAATQGI